MDQFSVAIVGGTGNLGSALALRLGAPGVRIIIGSRDEAKAKKAVKHTLKPKLRAGEMLGTTNQEAVKGADFVVIAVPYEGHAQMVSDLRGQLAGKIVIDTVVPLDKVRAVRASRRLCVTGGATDPFVGEAPVIGALHNISAVDLGDVEAPLGDVLVCGDDSAAKQKVMEIIQRIGANAYDGGPSSNKHCSSQQKWAPRAHFVKPVKCGVQKIAPGRRLAKAASHPGDALRPRSVSSSKSRGRLVPELVSSSKLVACRRASSSTRSAPWSASQSVVRRRVRS